MKQAALLLFVLVLDPHGPNPTIHAYNLRAATVALPKSSGQQGLQDPSPEAHPNEIEDARFLPRAIKASALRFVE